jgi:hypothetical protein
VALFPDIGDPALVARIHLGSCRKGDPQEAQLFEGMTSRPSDDPGPERSQVLDAVLIALKNAVAGEQAWLDFAQNEISREFVLKVTPATDRLGVRVGPFRLRPPERPALREISRWPWTLFSPRHRSEESWDGGIDFVAQSIRASATLAVVKSKTDDKHGWLAAGQVMARTILQSQALGINCTLHDPLRRSEARAALRLGVGHKGFAQIILRFPPLAAPQRAVMGPPISLGDSDSRS